MAKYRMLAPQLDIPLRDPRTGKPLGRRIVSRPTAGDPRRGDYTDSDEAPTVIEIDETCDVDLDHLLRAGAIVPATKAAEREAAAATKAAEGG